MKKLLFVLFCVVSLLFNSVNTYAASNNVSDFSLDIALYEAGQYINIADYNYLCIQNGSYYITVYFAAKDKVLVKTDTTNKYGFNYYGIFEYNESKKIVESSTWDYQVHITKGNTSVYDDVGYRELITQSYTDDYGNITSVNCTLPKCQDLDYALAFYTSMDYSNCENAADFLEAPAPDFVNMYYDDLTNKIYVKFNQKYFVDTSNLHTVINHFFTSDDTLISTYDHILDYKSGTNIYEFNLDEVSGYSSSTITITIMNELLYNDIWLDGPYIYLEYNIGSDTFEFANVEVTGPFLTETLPVQPYITSSDEGEDESVGLLTRIMNGIENLGSKFTGIVDGLLDGIVGLFVPDEEDIIDMKDKWNTLLSDRFGALYQSVYYILDFAGSFTEHAAAETVTFPSVTVDVGAPFTFGGYEVRLVPEGFETIVEILKKVISIVCTLAFLNGMKNKFSKEVLGNDN